MASVQRYRDHTFADSEIRIRGLCDDAADPGDGPRVRPDREGFGDEAVDGNMQTKLVIY